MRCNCTLQAPDARLHDTRHQRSAATRDLGWSAPRKEDRGCASPRVARSVPGGVLGLHLFLGVVKSELKKL